MRTVLNIAINDLRITLNERGSAIMLFVVPLIMMYFIGSVNFNSYTTPTIDIVRSAQQDEFGDKLVALLRAEGRKQFLGKDRFLFCDLSRPAEQPEACKLAEVKVSEDIAALSANRLKEGTLAAIVIPENFTADLRAGKNAALNLSSQKPPNETQAIQQVVDAVNARLGGAILSARVVTDAAKGDAAFYDKVFAAADQVWSSDPVQIEQTSSTTTGTTAGTGMGQSAAGIGAMFVLINGLNTAEVLLTERKRGTLQRLMVLPVSRFQILAGKLLGRYLVGLLSYSLLIGFGAILGVRWGDWLGVLAIVLTFTLASVAMGLAFSTVVKTAQQASGLGLLGMMTLAPLGGAMWPLTIVPAWMRTVGQISPIYWSQDAFTKMVFYGGTLVDVLPSVLVLLGFVVVFLGLGLLRFRYEQ